MVALPGAKNKPNFKPNWKEPATKISSWPPSGYAAAKSVSHFENFWTIARETGRENPWDIIIYNFQTEDPREVNWYLHHAVGCWRSVDNSNFTFIRAETADGSPSNIYLPPPSWVPDARFEKGSGAGKFIHGIIQATSAILTQLARRIPTVFYNNSRLGPEGLNKVAELINTREIAVKVNPSLPAHARYVFDDKTIELHSVPTLRSIFMAGALANEATHAFTHWRSAEVNLFSNEMVSSLAESVAAASLSVSWVRRQMDNTAAMYDDLYFPGWVWANHLAGEPILGQAQLDRNFPHPVHGVDKNPFTQIVRYHDAIPAYARGRVISLPLDWNG